jgi:hypothetical protein
MPGRMNVTDRTLLLAATVGALLLVVLAAVFGSGGDTTDSPTTYSSGSGGAKAVYLTLRAAHYPIVRWERSPRDLPADANATLILAEPIGAAGTNERAAVKDFLERGGRVIATGVSGASFLPNRRVMPDPIAGMTWSREMARSPSLAARAAPEITLAPQAYWQDEAAVMPLYGDRDDRDVLRVVQFKVGRGEALWWASATPLTNAGITEPGNLAFVLASLGDPKRAILWDEYFQGHRPPSATSVFGLPSTWATLPLFLGAAALLLTYSRRSGPIVVPAGESRLSPLEFVRTLGSLYQKAGAASVAVDIAYQRFRYGVGRRFGIAGADSSDALAGAVGAAAGLDAPALADLFRRCESAREDPHLGPAEALSLTQSLHDYAARLDLFRR